MLASWRHALPVQVYATLLEQLVLPKLTRAIEVRKQNDYFFVVIFFSSPVFQWCFACAWMAFALATLGWQWRSRCVVRCSPTKTTTNIEKSKATQKIVRFLIFRLVGWFGSVAALNDGRLETDFRRKNNALVCGKQCYAQFGTVVAHHTNRSNSSRYFR